MYGFLNCLIFVLVLTNQHIQPTESASTANVPQNINDCLAHIAEYYLNTNNYDPRQMATDNNEHLELAALALQVFDDLEIASLNDKSSSSSPISIDDCSLASIEAICIKYSCDVSQYQTCTLNGCRANTFEVNELIKTVELEIINQMQLGTLSSFEIATIFGKQHILKSEIDSFLQAAGTTLQFSDLDSYTYQTLESVFNAKLSLIATINQITGLNYLDTENFALRVNYSSFLEASQLESLDSRNIAVKTHQDILTELKIILEDINNYFDGIKMQPNDIHNAISKLNENLQIDYIFINLYNELATQLRAEDFVPDDLISILNGLKEAIDSFLLKIDVILPNFIEMKSLIESKISENSAEIQEASQNSVDIEVVKNFMNSIITNIQDQQISTEIEREAAKAFLPDYIKPIVASVELFESSLDEIERGPKIYDKEGIGNFLSASTSTLMKYNMHFNSEAEFFSQPYYGAIKKGIDLLITNPSVKNALKDQNISGLVFILD
ncbi:MAG: hypothetical protein MHMPM18_002394, partial [Marteilia pararefringens]